MRKSSTATQQEQDGEFDFPCSASFRDVFQEERAERRRRALGPYPRDARDYELYSFIRGLEHENFRLRAALDLVRLLPCRCYERTAPASSTFTGIGEEAR